MIEPGPLMLLVLLPGLCVVLLAVVLWVLGWGRP
jgi:hypothetical protein